LKYSKGCLGGRGTRSRKGVQRGLGGGKSTADYGVKIYNSRGELKSVKLPKENCFIPRMNRKRQCSNIEVRPRRKGP